MSTACCRLIDKFDKLLLLSSTYCQPLIVNDLTNLINYCFEKGIFPTEMKIANASSIFKMNYSLNKENYRPVSIKCLKG